MKNFTNWLPANLTDEERKAVSALAESLKNNPVACGAVAVMMLEECNYHPEAAELNKKLLEVIQ